MNTLWRERTSSSKYCLPFLAEIDLLPWYIVYEPHLKGKLLLKKFVTLKRILSLRRRQIFPVEKRVLSGAVFSGSEFLCQPESFSSRLQQNYYLEDFFSFIFISHNFGVISNVMTT